MNRSEAVQYQVDGLVVLDGAELPSDQPSEFPCDQCGGMVDLTGIITVTIIRDDGEETKQEMTEADARALLATTSIPPPPVMCDRHDPVEITTWASTSR